MMWDREKYKTEIEDVIRCELRLVGAQIFLDMAQRAAEKAAESLREASDNLTEARAALRVARGSRE